MAYPQGIDPSAPLVAAESGLTDMPMIGVYPIGTGSLGEGQTARFEIRRGGAADNPCSVHWATAPREAADISGQTSGTALFASGEQIRQVAVQTVDRGGTQGSRQLAVQISDPAGCWLDAFHLQAIVTILDQIEAPEPPEPAPPPVPPPPTPPVGPGVWWKPGPFNGRPWASGPFHWGYDWLVKYGRQVALPTAVCCNASGAGESRAATWELMAGGPKDQPETITPGSQLDWSDREATNWAGAWAYMPKNHGIMAMAFCMLPNSHRSDQHPDTWQRIANGEFDQYYLDMGARLARQHARAGRNLKHWFGRPNHEMNQTNTYRVIDSNRRQYKAAMERAFDLLRRGANYPLRWCHAPAPADWIGPFDDWIPDNCDALAMSYHPAHTVVDRASWLVFMNGTPGKRYGFYTDLIEAADRRGKPIAFPEWSPKYEAGRGCPIADKVLQWTYDELFARYQDRLVCECVHHRNTLIKGGYEDNQPGGAEAWDRAVDLYVRLWGGTRAP